MSACALTPEGDLSQERPGGRTAVSKWVAPSGLSCLEHFTAELPDSTGTGPRPGVVPVECHSWVCFWL